MKRTRLHILTVAAVGLLGLCLTGCSAEDEAKMAEKKTMDNAADPVTEAQVVPASTDTYVLSVSGMT